MAWLRTNCTDGPHRSAEGCGGARNGQNWEDCKMSWSVAAPGRDLTSTFAADGGIHYTGGGWGGCSCEEYLEGTYGAGRYHTLADSGGQIVSDYDAAGELQMAPHGNSTYKMERQCFSQNAWKGFWVQVGRFASEASTCESC